MAAPTKDQVIAAARHVATAGASIVGTLAAMKVISGGDAENIQNAINTIGHGTAEIITGLATLSVAVSGLYSALAASPLAQLFKGSRAVMADPEKVAQLRAAPIEDKASVAAVTDKLPEVASVLVLPTRAGNALADAVPSESVKVAA
jgi:hypothetical protein